MLCNKKRKKEKREEDDEEQEIKLIKMSRKLGKRVLPIDKLQGINIHVYDGNIPRRSHIHKLIIKLDQQESTTTIKPYDGMYT